jgi:SAM-dependent methyltransferase
MEVTDLEVATSSIDLVHSNATWEHLADVAAANGEVARVLKPGGLAYIEIHLFPSLSGGHDLPWIVPGRLELQGHLPWRHLRDPDWVPPVFLNRHTGEEFRHLFSATPGLELVDWRVEYTEGEELLRDEATRQALASWSDADLTTRSVIAILQRS